MNVNNRQNNRYTTPSGTPYGNRPLGRQMAVNERVQCDNDGVSGIVDGRISNRMARRMEGCANEEVLMGMPLAMAYVPWQTFENLYPLQQALNCGTLFQDLSMDFLGRRCN